MSERTVIESRADIETLLQSFYRKLLTDAEIGYFFTEIVPLDLSTHLPLIADFWESVLFNRNSYAKNVMAVHQHISSLSPIKKEHLDRWVRVFSETVDEQFTGERAELAKQRAASVATLMAIKLSNQQIKKI